jgi:hypothetical protein
MTNYILTGNLDVNGDMAIHGTVYDIKSLGALVKKLEEGGYKNIMELTRNQRTLDCNLEVDGNLIVVTFDCSITSKLFTSGSLTMLNTEVLE